MECSGNKRAFFNPKLFGTHWEEGAISQGFWGGVPLKYLMDIVGIREQASEIVFEGHDFGPRKDRGGLFSFKRSLPVNVALASDIIIAYHLNGQEIPLKHGYPLSVVVLSTLRAGSILVEGFAWTGQGVVSEVEISTDQGRRWKKEAVFRYYNEPYSWVRWNFLWEVETKGEYTNQARARDSHGSVLKI